MRRPSAVMARYNHVTNKDDLLDGMGDLVAGDINPPADAEAWREPMRGSAVSAHRVFQAHPWVNRMWFSRLPGPARLEHIESWFADPQRVGAHS